MTQCAFRGCEAAASILAASGYCQRHHNETEPERWAQWKAEQAALEPIRELRLNIELIATRAAMIQRGRQRALLLFVVAAQAVAIVLLVSRLP